MQIGAWKNFEELEEQITIDELYTLYHELTDKEIRAMHGTARAFGNDVDIEFGPTKPVKPDDNGGDVLKNLFGRVGEKLGREIEMDGKSKEFSGMKIGYNKGN